MRAKYARQIRRGIEDRLLYDRAFELGFNKRFLNTLYITFTAKVKKHRYDAFIRATRKENGRISTRHPQAFKNPDLRRKKS